MPCGCDAAGSVIVRTTASVCVLITEIVAVPLFVTNTSFASGASASDQGRSPTPTSANTAPAALITVTVRLSGFTLQIRSAPLLPSTISVVELNGAETGATPCSTSHLVGSLGNASELSPWPSWSVSAHSVGSFGNASRESGTPSPSVSTGGGGGPVPR